MANNNPLPIGEGDPRVNFCFRIIVQGIFSHGAISVDGLEDETDQIDYRQGHEETFVRQVRGLTKAGALVIVVPKTRIQVRDWRKFRESTYAPGGGEPDPTHKRKIIVEELDPIDRKTVLGTHIFKSCWVPKITDTKLDSLTSEIATLTIDIRHAGKKSD
jgi:phage tail-like protein